MIKLTFTYDKVTPESIADGDFSDTGFWAPGGWEYSMRNPEIRADVLVNPGDYETPWKPGELKAALRTARDLGICDDSGRWFSSYGDEADPRTAERTTYSLHIAGITPSTYRRIARILRGRR